MAALVGVVGPQRDSSTCVRFSRGQIPHDLRVGEAEVSAGPDTTEGGLEKKSQTPDPKALSAPRLERKYRFPSPRTQCQTKGNPKALEDAEPAYYPGGAS